MTNGEQWSRRTVLAGVGATALAFVPMFTLGHSGGHGGGGDTNGQDDTDAGSDASDASDAELYNVGVRPGHEEAGIRAAKEAAESVRKVIDFEDLGVVVNGRYTEAAVESLRDNPHIEYVERDATVSL